MRVLYIYNIVLYIYIYSQIKNKKGAKSYSRENVVVPVCWEIYNNIEEGIWYHWNLWRYTYRKCKTRSSIFTEMNGKAFPKGNFYSHEKGRVLFRFKDYKVLSVWNITCRVIIFNVTWKFSINFLFTSRILNNIFSETRKRDIKKYKEKPRNLYTI